MCSYSQVNGTTESDVAARPKPKPLGPTDKQIESRTTDGRRRITPIFIPPDAEESRDEEIQKAFKLHLHLTQICYHIIHNLSMGVIHSSYFVLSMSTDKAVCAGGCVNNQDLVFTEKLLTYLH